MQRLSALALVVLICWVVRPASAAGAIGEPPGQEVEESVQHDLSLTISPFHLFLHKVTGCKEGEADCDTPQDPWEALLPFIEITGEYRVLDDVGVSGLLGIGIFRAPLENTTDMVDVSAMEVGFAGRYYVFGDFEHGAQLGAAIDYVYINADAGSVTALGEGVVLGAFGGYKIAMDVGFTFEAQLGVQWWAARAATETGADAKSGSDVGPLLNLNIGWSFPL